MSLTLDWSDIALRLALAVFAGVALGFDRTERGRTAGMRTTLLVCLAAALAMIEANFLLVTGGKQHDSFAVMDIMRFPLGILTGMGFIGAGAILRRGEVVQGVTTAATLWLATVIGLCIGGGQIAAALAALGVAILALPGLKWVEARLWQDQRGILILRLRADAALQERLRNLISAEGCRVAGWNLICSHKAELSEQTIRCEVRWRAPPASAETPAFVREIARLPEVIELRWHGPNAD